MITPVKKKGFYCAGDTGFFNQWTRIFVLSALRHAPWAHLHVHVYDGTTQDEKWCQQHGVTFTQQPTPRQYCGSLADKRGYWVCHRFQLLPSLYSDDTAVWAVDCDSVFNRSMSSEEFDQRTQRSWVNAWGDPLSRDQWSIGYAAGFAANDAARHELSRRLSQHGRFEWAVDQIVLDQLLAEGLMQPIYRSHSNHVCSSEAFIWSGKGALKHAAPSIGTKKNFALLVQEYRQLLAKGA